MIGRPLRWLLVGVGALLLLAVGVLAVLPMVLDRPTMQAYVAQTASHAVGRPVKFSSLSVSLLPLPHVILRGLEIADDPRFGTKPLLRVGQMRVGLRVKPLLSLRIELASVMLQDVQVEVVEADGRWNVASLGGTPASPRPAAPRTVPGIPGSAAMGSVMVSKIALRNVAVNVRRGSVKDAGEIRIEGLDATVSGVGGPELVIQGDGRLEPGALRLRNIRGTVSMRGDIPVKGSLDLEGVDIAPLARNLIGPSPALSGPIKGRIQLSGTPSRLTGTGAIDLSRLTITEERRQCPPPVRRQLVLEDVHVPVVLRPGAIEGAGMRAKVSKGTAVFDLAAGLDASPLVRLTDIRIAGVQLQPLLHDYLCQAFAVSGPLDLTGELSLRSGDALRTMNGSGRFKVGAGRVVGEGALRTVREVLSAGNVLDMALRGKLADPSRTALDFDSITGTFKIVNGVARTDDTIYQGKDLRVAVTGTYALADARTDLEVVATQGRNQLRAQVTGSGRALRVVPTGVNVKEPAEVRKLLDRLLR